MLLFHQYMSLGPLGGITSYGTSQTSDSNLDLDSVKAEKGKQALPIYMFILKLGVAQRGKKKKKSDISNIPIF